MSGPKYMDIAYAPMAEARQCNRAQMDEWLATYTRLFAELSALGRRLTAVGGRLLARGARTTHSRM